MTTAPPPPTKRPPKTYSYRDLIYTVEPPFPHTSEARGPPEAEENGGLADGSTSRPFFAPLNCSWREGSRKGKEETMRKLLH
jgi:hypothetical protein